MDTAPRILLAEDNSDNQLIYATLLRHVGYDVRIAEHGADAVAIAASWEPALVLMDLALPGLDGWEAAARIRASPRVGDVPILALTAHAMPEMRERALAAGFRDYLVKPIAPQDVLVAVRAALGHAGGDTVAPTPFD